MAREVVFPSVIEFLDLNPGKHYYHEVANALGIHYRGIGSSMRAICSRGKHKYCRRVVDAKTGKPRYQCPGNSE